MIIYVLPIFWKYVNGELLLQLDNLCVEVGSTTTTYLNNIILGLGTDFSPIYALSRQKCAMRPGTRNLHELKVRRYTDCMIEINEYFPALPVVKESDKIGETELNKIILNSIPNVWSKKACVQGFDCEYIT